MKLSVVIPAFNEEDAIGAIIERSQAARARIIEDSPVDDVEIVVVSDGSTDRTAQIASGFDGIHLIALEKNRGYGAAIKRGFAECSGELVGFLDADGTCDPRFFATLCNALLEEDAAVAIGSRMGPDSRMPRLRRFGNRVYAVLLSALSNRVVTDTASGMRVIRREALDELYPLPDGLNFTPAMSARVLMDDRLTIIERSMPYEERIGESKLNVLRDGLRFLRTILEMTMMWRPAKLLMCAAVACLAVMVLLAMHPLEMWLRLRRLEESMICRLLFCSFLGTLGVTLLSSAVVCDHLRRLLDRRRGLGAGRTFLWGLLDGAYSYRGLALALAPVLPAIAWLVGPGLWTWTAHGYVEVHWSRVVLAGLVAFGTAQLLITVLIVNLLRFHTARRTLRQPARAKVLGSACRAVPLPAASAAVADETVARTPSLISEPR